ncbi:hypothetical protein HERIO_2716 [Hepatospora eriocheir]|uniref:Uncharacterized protein n=1 Tax=Hepatospora eriocheir TaxID=1081669 RepID=A0A1X0QC48_9MICR|nr:hypothetical protein HERIO_2716 [Hepatospora eriocheir]
MSTLFLVLTECLLLSQNQHCFLAMSFMASIDTRELKKALSSKIVSNSLLYCIKGIKFLFNKIL